MRISEEDLALVHALQIAPRVPWQDAAEILGAHPATLARRWERLRSQGLAWVTGHLRADPSDMVLAFIDVECVPGQRDAAASALAAIPDVQTIDVATSHPELNLTVFARNLLDLAERVLPVIAGLPDVVRAQTEVCTRLHAGGHSWRLAALDRTQIAAFSELARVEPYVGRLPDGSYDLVPLLTTNGRASAAEMARELGRSTATVHRQLAKLRGSGVLTFRCEVAQGPAGFPVACTWRAKIPSSQHAQAGAAIRGLRQVRLAASTTGRTNFQIMMWLRTVADIMTAETTLQERVPGIELVESVVMLRAVKRVGHMLRPEGQATGEAVTLTALLD